MSTPNESRLAQPGSPSTWLNRLNPFDFLRQNSETSVLSEVDEGDEESSQGEEGDEDLNVDELLWEAQNALIQHAYGKALSCFKKASQLGSSAACLSLGHLYQQGLHNPKLGDGKHHHHHSPKSPKSPKSPLCISADYRQAAHWYIKGLEIEAETSIKPSSRAEAPSDDSDEGIGGMHGSHSSLSSLSSAQESGSSSQRREMSTDTLCDLAFALTSLYRIGKLFAPSHGDEKTDAKEKGEDLYCKGARVAYRLTQHAVFKSLRRSLSAETNQLQQAVSLDDSEILARGSYISLCYLLALSSYPSGQNGTNEPADHSESLEWFQKAISVQKLPGSLGGQKQAEDLVQKAKYRIDMIRIAKEREEEMNLIAKQRNYHRFHSPKSDQTKTTPRAPWEPLLSPSELLDTPLSPPKVSPVVAVLKHIKPSPLRMQSYQVTERVHHSLRHPSFERKLSAPSVASSPDMPTIGTPPRKAKFTFADEPASPVSPAVSSQAPWKKQSRSIRSVASFRAPTVNRVRTDSVSTQISIESVGVPSSSLYARASTTSISSLWSGAPTSRTTSYVSLSDLYKGSEVKQSWRAKTLAMQAGSALKHVLSYGSLSEKRTESATSALEGILQRDAEALQWTEEPEEEEEGEEEESSPPPITIQAPTPTSSHRPSYLQQRSSLLRQSFLSNAHLDPTLSHLEANSIINAKSRCAFCQRKGLNFPTCTKCKKSFCSRQCRVVGAGNGERHVC